MKYPETLSTDLKYLSEYYEWTAEDKKEIRRAFENCEPMVLYFTVLAAAHRAGYSQGAANGHVRLREWFLSQGLSDPYSDEFDVNELDSI